MYTEYNALSKFFLFLFEKCSSWVVSFPLFKHLTNEQKILTSKCVKAQVLKWNQEPQAILT